MEGEIMCFMQVIQFVFEIPTHFFLTYNLNFSRRNMVEMSCSLEIWMKSAIIY